MTPLSIRPTRLADAIADRIRQLILEGALQPGDRLIPERELSVRLDVSRPSLREGLNKLVELGLLETDRQGVCYVSEKIGHSLRDPLVLLLDDPEARLDCLEFRLVVETAAAGYAAERASEVDRAAFAQHFEAMEAAHAREDVDAIARADADFHLAIYEAAHNLLVLHFMRSLETLLRSNVYLNRRNLFEHRRAPASQLAEHRRIFEALMARDAEGARAAAQAHLLSTIETQHAIRDAERRQGASIRRLAHKDLVAPQKKRGRVRPVN